MKWRQGEHWTVNTWSHEKIYYRFLKIFKIWLKCQKMKWLSFDPKIMDLIEKWPTMIRKRWNHENISHPSMAYFENWNHFEFLEVYITSEVSNKNFKRTAYIGERSTETESWGNVRPHSRDTAGKWEILRKLWAQVLAASIFVSFEWKKVNSHHKNEAVAIHFPGVSRERIQICPRNSLSQCSFLQYAIRLQFFSE